MRIFLAVLVVVGVGSAAQADVKAIETLVKTNITGLASLEDDAKLGFATAAVVYGRQGRIDLTSDDGCVPGAVANAFYGCVQAEISHAPGTIIANVDAAKGIAWFQAQYVATLASSDDETGKDRVSKTTWRVGGVAVKQGKAWKIVAAMYTETVSDKDLLKGTGGKVASGAPALTGDKKVAGALAAWFPAGFGAASAKIGTLIASGTAPAELGQGAAATKTAKVWDTLKLGATKIDATTFAGGAIAFATAEVKLPRKTKGAVTLWLGAVLVPEGTAWKWVSLQYMPESEIGR